MRLYVLTTFSVPWGVLSSFQCQCTALSWTGAFAWSLESRKQDVVFRIWSWLLGSVIQSPHLWLWTMSRKECITTNMTQGITHNPRLLLERSACLVWFRSYPLYCEQLYLCYCLHYKHYSCCCHHYQLNQYSERYRAVSVLLILNAELCFVM